MGAIGPDRRFGQWVTTGRKPLGSGGNGEVWRVRGDDGGAGAIKLLGRGGRSGRYRLGRFRDEVRFLLAHPEVPGILPVLDSCISPWQPQPGRSCTRATPASKPANMDVENLILYNIDATAGGCFRLAVRHGVRFEMAVGPRRDPPSGRPTRSGCYFCFFQRKHEWVGLQDRHPDLFQKAIDYEHKVDYEQTAMKGRKYT
jgi:hypothetical protein